MESHKIFSYDDLEERQKVNYTQSIELARVERALRGVDNIKSQFNDSSLEGS